MYDLFLCVEMGDYSLFLTCSFFYLVYYFLREKRSKLYVSILSMCENVWV